jgi:hypothetical protein
MSGDGREAVFRTGLLAGAVLSWAVSITLTVSVYLNWLDVLQGWGMISNMCLALSITLTVVWAQLRTRRVVTEVFRAGITAGQEDRT